MACNATIHDCSWLMNGNPKCRVNGKPYKQCKKDYPEMHGGKKRERTPTGGEYEIALKVWREFVGTKYKGAPQNFHRFLIDKCNESQPTGEGEKCPKCVYYADENCTMMAMQGTARCSFKKRHGTGEGEKCLWCNGTGDVTPLGGGPFKENVCSSCHGTGKAGK